MSFAADLTVDYVDAAQPQALLTAQTLAVFGFGSDAADSADARYLKVPLTAAAAPAPFEVWRSPRPVAHGRDGAIAWASDGVLRFGAIEMNEDDGGIEAATEAAYRQMLAHLKHSQTPHLLRVWNYLSGITLGEGDDERYRRFCVGRARGLGVFDVAQLPAATAIGRSDTQRCLQVYWLACAVPGQALENPRQVSAYHYPRQYGPQSPSFARAMLPAQHMVMPLLLSGTAAVVGHASQHGDDVLAQLDETFRNFDALLAAARAKQPALPARFDSSTRLKVYVRDAAHIAPVQAALAQRLGGVVPYLVVHAAICRRELAIEIDGVHGVRGVHDVHDVHDAHGVLARSDIAHAQAS